MIRFQKTILLLFITLALPACLVADPYCLQTGDLLQVTVVGKSELSTKQPVTPDGTVSLPLVGRVNVQGRSLPELDGLLTKRYGRYVASPQIVTVLEKSKQKAVDDRPIFISIYDVAKRTTEVKKTASSEEAIAYVAVHPYSVRRNGVELGPTSNIIAGDIVMVRVGREPDFIEDNWYKLLSAAGLVLGIFNSLHR